jgi:hypothetical protein
LNSAVPALDGTVASFVSCSLKDEIETCSIRWRRGAVERGDSVDRLLLIKKLLLGAGSARFRQQKSARAGRRGIVAVTGSATVGLSRAAHLCRL